MTLRREHNTHLKPIYNLSQDELMELQKYIDENLENGFIWHSESLSNAIILFVKKKNGSLQMCVDYCGLNQLTINNQYLLPFILRLLDQLTNVKVSTKVDLLSAYNHVQI